MREERERERVERERERERGEGEEGGADVPVYWQCCCSCRLTQSRDLQIHRMLERERERRGGGGGGGRVTEFHYARIKVIMQEYLPGNLSLREKRRGAGEAETAAVNTQCFVWKFLCSIYLHTFSFIHLFINSSKAHPEKNKGITNGTRDEGRTFSGRNLCQQKLMQGSAMSRMTSGQGRVIQRWHFSLGKQQTVGHQRSVTVIRSDIQCCPYRLNVQSDSRNRSHTRSSQRKDSQNRSAIILTDPTSLLQKKKKEKKRKEKKEETTNKQNKKKQKKKRRKKEKKRKRRKKEEKKRRRRNNKQTKQKETEKKEKKKEEETTNKQNKKKQKKRKEKKKKRKKKEKKKEEDEKERRKRRKKKWKVEWDAETGMWWCSTPTFRVSCVSAVSEESVGWCGGWCGGWCVCVGGGGSVEKIVVWQYRWRMWV